MHSLEHRVLAYMKELQLIQQGDKLLIACSGGVDSMALLSFFQRFRHYLQIDIAVAHVDHMLRGEVSAQDRLFVEQYCNDFAIPVYSCAIPIASIYEQEGGNTQAICRRERYQFFEQLMQEHAFTKLVTAHHADDQLESMLMALTKASSLNGLKGILPIRSFAQQFVIRPFLGVTKAQIGEYLHSEALTYREDASNAKDAYTRNRFRHHIVPLLKQENALVSEHAVQISQQLIADDLLLMQLAQDRFSHLFERIDGNCYKVSVSTLQNEPLALQRRLILILLNYLYNESNTIQSYALCTAILALFDTSEGSRSVDLPENFIARRHYDEIVFEQKQRNSSLEKQQLTFNKWYTFGSIRMFIGELAQCDDAFLQQHQPKYFSASSMAIPLIVRAPEKGDRLALQGMQQKKKVSRIFIDDKIPFIKRANWPLLVDSNDEPIALLAVRLNNKFSNVKLAKHDCVLIVESDECY
ncbi:tRNA lysidine(34) synthetase TilS [Solibacillus daqui]|uniref:tRNA lysidine(34) synthetase TilS n=1 Tax=Solibacillus daqui TaxID=2912187 RepID=UPI0023668C29|nr:tRNA lysidine(34) synthetase TilS [Solibacillus daqui]